MSNETPPYPPPIGKRWARSWFGLGAWVLVDDEQYPAPPPGYRYAPNFYSGRPELVALYGKGVDWFSDGNEIKKPSGINHAQLNNFGTPSDPLYFKGPIQESGNGCDGIKDDPTCKPRPGSDVYSVKKRDAGIFG